MHENDGADDDMSGAGGVRENSRRAYFKEFKKVVDAADVILEVPLPCARAWADLCRSSMRATRWAVAARAWSRPCLQPRAARSLCWC